MGQTPYCDAVQGPISRFAASMAEARAERRDSSNAPVVDLDDLDGKSVAQLRRIRRWRVGRLTISVIVVPVTWLVAPHLPGLLPVFALAACIGGFFNAVLTTYLVVHVRTALRAAYYEASFAPSGLDEDWRLHP